MVANPTFSSHRMEDHHHPGGISLRMGDTWGGKGNSSRSNLHNMVDHRVLDGHKGRELHPWECIDKEDLLRLIWIEETGMDIGVVLLLKEDVLLRQRIRLRDKRVESKRTPIGDNNGHNISGAEVLHLLMDGSKGVHLLCNNQDSRRLPPCLNICKDRHPKCGKGGVTWRHPQDLVGHVGRRKRCPAE